MKTLPLSILASLAFASAAVAQQVTYSTTFDEFQSGFSVSGATSASPGVTGGASGEWITTDLNQNDSVLPDSSPFATYSGDQWGIMGGAVFEAPSQASSELWYPVDISHSFQNSMTFDITTSNMAHSNTDTFGMTYRDTAGDLLFQVLFTPDASNPSQTLDAVWNTGGSNHSTGIQISRNAEYTLEINGDLDTGDFQTVIGAASSSGTFDGTMTAGATLGEAGVTWVEQNSGSYGSNSIVFNDYTAVPEPSVESFAMLSFAGVGVAWLLRRRRMGFTA